MQGHCLKPFNVPSFGLEIPIRVRENFPKPLIDFWGKDTVLDPVLWFKKAESLVKTAGAEFLSLYFNLDGEIDEIENATALFSKIQKISSIPLMVRGSGRADFDGKFLPKIIESLEKPAIIAFAQELNYEPIVKSILKSPLKADIKLVLRAPIDITLTKELNALSLGLGLPLENIIMDTDTGAVGMGLDYGYSIIERLKIAKNEGDNVLSPPVIVFSGEESFKTKESKSDDFKDSRGSLKTRFNAVEIATTMALITAGADFAVCWNPKTIETILNIYSMNRGAASVENLSNNAVSSGVVVKSGVKSKNSVTGGIL